MQLIIAATSACANGPAASVEGCFNAYKAREGE